MLLRIVNVKEMKKKKITKYITVRLKLLHFMKPFQVKIRKTTFLMKNCGKVIAIN